MRSQPRVVAVVVTWNRRDLLKLALGALRGQTRAVDQIVVVDNSSSDGTADMVRRDFAEVDLLTMCRNTGGASASTSSVPA